MEVSSQKWSCGDCGTELQVSADEQSRQLCPSCGSFRRTAHLLIQESLAIDDHLKIHAKHREGGKKIMREVIEGDDFHRNTKRWNVMRRIIDRTNNWYEEIFKDKVTGEVLHHTAEPLTEHKRPKS